VRDRSCSIDHSIEELMASPPIPLEALLELRRLLDSMQTAETRCEETPLVQEAHPTEAAAPPVRARRRSPQAEKSNEELPSFQ
jgi:hypothetical protein